MVPAFVLVHSPAVGPATWQPVADRLGHLGRDALVPSLVHVAAGEPPYWPRVLDVVNESLAALEAGRPVVLVAHSNAGLFVPVIVDGAARPVAACVFVDAGLPARDGPTPVAPAELVSFLAEKVRDGRLPRWTDWWDSMEVAELFPDPVTQAEVWAEQPRLPLAYFLQTIPVPPGWEDRPCGYLQFSSAYDDDADGASDRGWPVHQLPGLHLHQVVDPVAVADRLIALTRLLLS